VISAQSKPPALDGFSFVSWLGGGGFADVFLYQQHLPDRRVAVKVLRETVDDDEARRNFNAEANLMARVSTHPNIVTIHGASVSADRRPYLVMEYYPLAHYGDRLRQGQMAVHEVLEVGIKIGSAVETAHRNSILHRDIKPANILTSDFGEPGLTDFGISAAQTEHSTDESMGFSPPYAPPEILADESPGDERSDVYSLAATLWAMLAGHSPFELPGRELSRSEVISRGLNLAVTTLPRADVPSSLELALQQALSKNPDRRPTSALSFARTLQGVEQELGYRPTPLNLLRDAVITGPKIEASDLKGDKTRIGRGKVVHPDRPSPLSGPNLPTVARTSTRSVGVDTPGRVDTGLIDGIPAAGLSQSFSTPSPMVRLSMPTVDEETGTIRARRPSAPSVPDSVSALKRMPTWAWIGLSVVLVGVLVTVGLVTLSGTGSETRPTEQTIVDQGAGDLSSGDVVVLKAVTQLAAVRDGSTVHFTWAGSPAADVAYLITRVDIGAGSPPPSAVVDVASFDVKNVDASSVPCVSVFAFIAGVTESPRPAPVVCVGS
jgi:serine/threonine protein kinase